MTDETLRRAERDPLADQAHLATLRARACGVVRHTCWDGGLQPFSLARMSAAGLAAMPGFRNPELVFIRGKVVCTWGAFISL